MTITQTEVTLFVGGAAIGFTILCICGALTLLAIADEHSHERQRRIGRGLREARRRIRGAWAIATARTPHPAFWLDEDDLPPATPGRLPEPDDIERYMAGIDYELERLVAEQSWYGEGGDIG